MTTREPNKDGDSSPAPEQDKPEGDGSPKPGLIIDVVYPAEKAKPSDDETTKH